MIGNLRLRGTPNYYEIASGLMNELSKIMEEHLLSLKESDTKKITSLEPIVSFSEKLLNPKAITSTYINSHYLKMVQDKIGKYPEIIEIKSENKKYYSNILLTGTNAQLTMIPRGRLRHITIFDKDCSIVIAMPTYKEVSLNTYEVTYYFGVDWKDQVDIFRFLESDNT